VATYVQDDFTAGDISIGNLINCGSRIRARCCFARDTHTHRSRCDRSFVTVPLPDRIQVALEFEADTGCSIEIVRQPSLAASPSTLIDHLALSSALLERSIPR
jgi:hypothetical protein